MWYAGSPDAGGRASFRCLGSEVHLKGSHSGYPDYCNHMGIPLMYAAYRQSSRLSEMFGLGALPGLGALEYAPQWIRSSGRFV